MVDIFHDDGTPVPNPNIVNKNSPRNLSYHIDKKLLAFLKNKVKDRIQKKDKDYVMLIDGYEGAGKSTFAQQVGKFVDPTMTIDQVCMTANEWKKAILTANKGQCVIYDEAVTGLTAGESISRIGKLLKSMMMQMRQKNLFVIVILPALFEFNKYAVLSRARSFFHIYEVGERMGFFAGYNRKDMRNLYLKGKKTHSYKIRSHFTGRFYGKYSINEEEYRKKKEEALMAMDEVDGKMGESKFSYERKIAYANLYLALKKYEKCSQSQLAERFQAVGLDLTRVNVNQMVLDSRKAGKLIIDT